MLWKVWCEWLLLFVLHIHAPAGYFMSNNVVKVMSLCVQLQY